MTDLKNKIFILDGAMGTMIQKYGLTEEDYHDGPFSHCAKELKGNNECLNLTRPEIIKFRSRNTDAGSSHLRWHMKEPG